MNKLFLSLDDAVEIAVREFDADAVLARQEFMQKCYISDNQYENGFFDGVGESLNAVRNLMDKHIEKEQEMIECNRCGFYDSEFEGCTCSSLDKWYACPIESKKPENIKALKEYAEWLSKTESEDKE